MLQQRQRGVTNRDKPYYGLVYRSIGHASLRDFRKDIQKQTPPYKYKPYAPPGGFDLDIKTFTTAVAELEEKRHTADYDPMVQMRRSDAALWIGTARAALRRFQSANAEHRFSFLILLLFTARR